MKIFVGISTLLWVIFPLANTHAEDTPVFFRCAVDVQSLGIRRSVDCATVEVPLDYAQPEGDKLSLFIVRLPARTRTPNEDPLLMIAGGPGQSASESHLFIDKQFRRVHQFRDMYLIDQRGTGQSSPLRCPSLEQDDWQVEFDAELTRKLALSCLSEFKHDPRFFTTSVAIKDLEYVRKRLGVAQWNVYGTSYGTRVAQHYLRRYPEAVRAVVLDSVVPPEINLGPNIALDSQRALDRLLKRCADEDACAQSFPELEKHVLHLMKKLRKQSITVHYEDIQAGKIIQEPFSMAHLAIVIRFSLYQDEQFALLPLLLYEAAHKENFAPLARLAKQYIAFFKMGMNYGMHNSVVCSEDFQPEQTLTGQAMANNYLGHQIIDAITEICRVWPKGLVDKDFKQALVSNKPVLLLSGSEDPVTPPANADIAAKQLTNARHIVLPGQGHSVSSLGCARDIVSQFIDDPEAELRTACRDRLKPAPFFIDFHGAEP